MLDEYAEEELQIMEERDQPPRTLNTRTFSLPIRELRMYPSKTLPRESTIADLVTLMQTERIGGVMITHEGKLAGIVTERDLLLKVLGRSDVELQAPVTTIWTADPDWLLEDDPIAFLMHKMHVGGYRHVPIVNEAMEPISLISIRDVLTFILDFFPDEILKIPDEPFRGVIGQDGA